MQRPIPNLFVAASLLVVLFLTGCSQFFSGPRKTDRSSSVVAYLYPGQDNPLPPTNIPVLRLPLRVGIAFVPSASDRYTAEGISEMQKTVLLERVAAEFKAYPFVQSIEIIPATYLRPQGGFENLDQLSSLLGLDVVALVAYDQVQFTNDNLLSLTYWTIVGAYVFHGSKNDTHTLMEAAVYDIPSRHLLFRAPGASEVHASAAGMYLDQNLRRDGATGLSTATDDMIKNLKTSLEAFRERAKQSPGEVKIEHKAGYSGGGASGGVFGGAIAALLLLGRWQSRRR